MPSQNITTLTDYAGGQSPVDLIYLGKSPFGATDDRKSTLNDFLSIITKNITDGALRFGQFAAPTVSAANAGAIYFDSASKTFQVSENGGAYVALKTLAAGSVNEIQYNGGSGAFAANAAFTYDSTTNTVNIGAAGLTGKLKLTHTNTRALTIQPGVQSAARTFTWMTGYGNANQAVITDGFGNLSYGDFIPYPLPGVGDEVLYNAAGSLGASSQFQWNDTARVLSFVTGSSNASIYFNTSVSTANIKFQSSAGIPGSQAGLIFPYIGGDQTSGHGLWWSDGTYLNTSRFNLQLGFNFQGAASSTSPLKIRKATGTSADGNIVFAFFPDSGFFDLQPFGVSAGETSSLRFSELAANGTNYIEFKAPDALTGNTTFTWPNGAGSAGQVLTTNGSNTLSWTTPGGGGLTIGTTAITSGTAGRILYETSGNVVGEIAGSSVDANGAVQFAATARSSGVAQYFRINTPADTGQTASTESVGAYFGGNGSGSTVTRTWAAGAITLQRENVFVAPTYSFASASTITNAATIAVSNPIAGTNATITIPAAIYLPAQDDAIVFIGSSGNAARTVLSKTGGNAEFSIKNYWSSNVASGIAFYNSGAVLNSDFIRLMNASRTGEIATFDNSGRMALNTGGIITSTIQAQIRSGSASRVGLRVDSAATPSVDTFQVSSDNGTTTHFKVTSTGAPSSPGAGTTSERYGASSVAAGTRGVAFGYQASASNTDGLALGYNPLASGNGSIALGTNVTASGSNTVAIDAGGNLTVSGANTVAIGTSGSSRTISGQQAVYIGNMGTSSINSVVVIGTALPTAANQVVISPSGSSNTGGEFVFFGKGVTHATPTAYTINGTGGSGTDIAGAAVNLAGGLGTGTGIPGTIGMQFARAGSTGSSLNTLSDEWRASYSTTDTVTLGANIKTSTTALTSAAAINALWTTATHASRTAAITFSIVNNAAALTEVFRIAPTALTLADAVNLVFNTTTGTKIATATGQKIGFWNASPVVQPTSAALTNNVTSGGTANTISDYSDLTVYATDAATIRSNFYQLASKLKEISDALRLIGILG